MSSRSWALAGLIAIGVVAGPGASAASAGLWSAPATLGDNAGSAAGDVAVDADGTAIVAWAVDGGPVRAAVRSARGTFGRTQTLAPQGAQAPATAIDARGGALVAWSSGGSLGLAERTREKPALTTVPTGVTGVDGRPDVAFAANRRAIVVWAGVDGAIHALSHELGGATTALGDLAAGPGNAAPQIGAAGGHVVAAWTNTARTGGQVTTRVRAATLAPGGAFGAAEDVASATSDTEPPAWSGSQLAAKRVVVSEGGAADVLIDALEFLGVPGEVGRAGLVAARPAGAWTEPQRLGSAIGLQVGGRYETDLAAGPGGDALYVAGERSDLAPTMIFSARQRPAGLATYGPLTTVDEGATGEVRAAPLAARRFLALMRVGSGLRSRAGAPATGFSAPLTFRATDASRLVGLAGAPSGLAAAAWVTTAGRMHAAIYDDSLNPRSLPPPAARDTRAPVLSRLRVSPRRFAARRRAARSAVARGARIRWRLSEPARVTLRVDRVRAGFRRGGRCVVRRPRKRPVRRCHRFARVGSFVRVARGGRSVVRFNGRMRHRALRPGPYRLTAIARDASRNRAKAKRARFRIVRR